MWTRAELKTKAKEILRYSYWSSFLAVLIIETIIYLADFATSFFPLALIVISIFLLFPLTVGRYFYFLRSSTHPKGINNLFFAFRRGRYMKIVGAMAWMSMFITLWCLIPIFASLYIGSSFLDDAVNLTGLMTNIADYINDLSPDFISESYPVMLPALVLYLAGAIVVFIKHIAYGMTPCILADNPSIGYKRALKLSIAMTHGHKGAIFVLALSFIGWGILAVLPWVITSQFLPMLMQGQLGTLIFTVSLSFLWTYTNGTEAQLYLKLREIAIQNGITTREELTSPFGY